jgi:hypothetical protein
MTIFHFITVKPDECAKPELAQLQQGDYYVVAAHAETAWAAIKDDPAVLTSSEVWVAEHAGSSAILLSPAVALNTQTDMGAHQRWVSEQNRYRLIHQGPMPITQAGCDLESR